MSRSPSRDRSASRAGRTLAAASGGGGGGGGGFDPLTLTPALWLRAKDLGTGSFTTWADQSGHGFNAVTSGTAVASAATPSGGKAAALTSGIITPASAAVGKLFASTNNNDGTTGVANLVDGNSSTRWASAAGSPTGQIVQRLATSYAATSYNLTPYATALTDAPTAWTFQGWDGSAWVTLDTRSGVSGWAASTSKNFTFSNSTVFSKYRLNVSAAGATYCQLTEFTIDGATLITPAAELWVVVKSGDTSGQSWQLGTSGSTSHFTFSGTVYDQSFVTTRQSFTPSPTVAGAWRLYRVGVTSAGSWQAWIDNTSQNTTTGRTFAYPSPSATIANSWTGQIAEALILDRSATAGEVTDLIAYFNTEHGLTVT